MPRKAIDAPTNVLNVTVPALEAWLELERGDLASATRLVDPAHRWAVDADVPLHHGVLEAIVVLGWCHVGGGELALAAEVAALATEYAESLGFPWDVVRAGVLSAEVQRLGTGADASLEIVRSLRPSIDRSATYLIEQLDVAEAAALIAAQRFGEARAVLDHVPDHPRRRLLRARRLPRRPITSRRGACSPSGAPGRLRCGSRPTSSCRRREARRAEDDLARALQIGAETGWLSPFLGHGERIDELLHSVQVERLHPVLAHALTSAPARTTGVRPAIVVSLTEREKALLEFLPTHLSYAQIGERMYLSVNTVKSNLKSVYRKLGVGSRAEAVEMARRLDLL